MKSLITIVLAGAFVLSGCATTSRSTMLGIGVGAATGAAASAALHNGDKGKVIPIGAIVGAVVGGIAGHFTHKGLEKRDARVRKDTLFNLEKFGVSGVSEALKSDGLKSKDEPVIIITDDAYWLEGTTNEK